ncbi:hypothetical protein [Burkholderia ubonensis]|uniref:hypothetical protein n=1 Tax=Burkholderia ubonensis TaxID=101571 RepID=UPI00075F27C5|nr:hypothetical protein [Burkholderia ubonensis]KVO10272.1 hypothetical protein WJ73_21400 [Burkholderia ubonensis]KVT84178.1 hypothetical protein WK58_31645 [Burkholderia ubonensis]KWC16360.1 hypothetical protein WL47_00330 [Burkholderia ubonensis]
MRILLIAASITLASAAAQADERDPRILAGFSRFTPKLEQQVESDWRSRNGHRSYASDGKCMFGYADRQAGMCNEDPAKIAQDRAEFAKWEKFQSEHPYERVDSIPGICVGDDCKRIRKIQLWDAHTGQMLN